MKALSDLVDSYFKSKEFEKSGRIYRALGIEFFKDIVPTYGDYTMRAIRKHKKNYRLIRHKGELEGFNNITKINESIHLASFLISTPLSLIHLFNGDYPKFAIGAGLNLIINIYPIMLQRYNRARLTPLLERLEEREITSYP
jgi:hypothetical protein